MARDFEPGTQVYFGQTGIDLDQKVFIEGKSPTQMQEWCQTMSLINGYYIECEALSYQRTGSTVYVAVDREFALLQACDTIWYRNDVDLDPNPIWWIGHIVGVEWINPNCNYVHFVIDAFSTFGHRINWDKSACYVDREHVKGDWVGSNPAFSNMGPAEGIAVEPDTVLFTYNKHFECDKCLVYTPYNKDDYKPNFGSEIKNGIYDAMNAYIMDASEVASYLKGVAESDEADISGVQGIYTFPSELENADGTAHDERIDLPWVSPPADYPEINNSKCWSGEFCQIKLMSWLGGAINYNPQWFGGGKDSMPFSYRAFLQAGELHIQATLKPNNETFTWEGFKDFILSIKELPQAHWVGDGYAQYKSTWMFTDILQGANNVGNRITGILRGEFDVEKRGPSARALATDFSDALTNAVGAAADISAIVSNIKQQRMSGLVTGGSVASSPNSAAVQKTYGFTVVAYGLQPYLIKTVDAFFDRYGYNVNTIKVPEVNSRPFWNFVKTREAHVDGNIPYTYRREIEDMLNGGVTFWKSTSITKEHPIGDFSDPKRNKEGG